MKNFFTAEETGYDAGNLIGYVYPHLSKVQKVMVDGGYTGGLLRPRRDHCRERQLHASLQMVKLAFISLLLRRWLNRFL